MKYVIPCAGIGSRLKPLTDMMPKELILINNIPVIYFTIDLIKKADKNPFICIIISSSKIPIKNYLLQTFPNLKFEFCFQEEPKGLADAVYKAKDFINKEPFILLMPDHFVLDSKILEEFISFKSSLILAQVEKMEDARKYGVIYLNKEEKTIEKIIEKPFLIQPGQYLCSSCIYRLPSSIFKAIEKNETEFLQDAINITIKENEKYFVYDKQFVAYDMGTMQGLETTRKLLKDYKIKK